MSYLSEKNFKVSTIFFLLTTVVLLVLLIINYTKKPKEEFGYNSTTVLAKIINIQELALVKYNYTGVVGFKDNYKILNISVPFTDKYFLLKYNGYIKAGINFERIRVDVEDKSVHVSMPKPELMDIVIDEKSVKVYDESENAFNPIKISDYNQALIKEKDTMKKDAVNQGILKDAKKQSELAIRSMLEQMGFEEIVITDEVVLPSKN